LILSDGDIRKAIDDGAIEIDPLPSDDQFQPSALDLHLGNIFKVWSEQLRTHGTKVVLNLAEQEWPLTSDAWLRDAETEKDGSIILPPFNVLPQVLLAKTHNSCRSKRASVS
jgi:deoxycytidine triphosphate deaminase